MVLVRYAGIIFNDFTAAPGVCLSFFAQGCPIHCPGCHNPQTWDFKGGLEFNSSIIPRIIKGLQENGIYRDLCIMGGEPLCEENVFETALIIKEVKEQLPDIKIYIWSGYLYEDLLSRARMYSKLQFILDNADYLIDGPFKQEERDVTLFMRGSKNQRIIDLKTGEILDIDGK